MEEIKEESRVVRSGIKEFKNNRNYLYLETWKETESGLIMVEKLTDDGLGTKKTENFQAKRQGDTNVYESLDGVVDHVGENKKVFISRGALGAD